MTISMRFTGVISIVAIVPLSFSPAMDSGATDMHDEAKSENIKRGISIAIRLVACSSASTKSKTSLCVEFIVNAFNPLNICVASE